MFHTPAIRGRFIWLLAGGPPQVGDLVVLQANYPLFPVLICVYPMQYFRVFHH
jgi:hypothetical protein